MNEEHPLNVLVEQTEQPISAPPGPISLPNPSIPFQEVAKGIEQEKAPVGASLGPKFVQKSIRTYESDVAELMATKRSSLVDMVIAEQSKKKEVEEKVAVVKEVKTKSFNKKILFVGLSLLIIVCGLIGFYIFYQKSALSTPKPQVKQALPQSLVAADAQAVAPINLQSGGNLSGQDLAIEINLILKSKSGIGDGKIVEVVLSKKSGENNVRVPAFEAINAMSIGAPDILVRSLENNLFMGGYMVGSDPKLFMILKNNFFQNSYAGMLSWEKSMPDDLSTLFNLKTSTEPVAPIENVASTTETSSTTSALKSRPVSSFFGIRGKFVDKQIRNRDVREFIDDRGNMLFLYAFLDKDTLMISADEGAMLEVIDRIEKEKYIR